MLQSWQANEVLYTPLLAARERTASEPWVRHLAVALAMGQIADAPAEAKHLTSERQESTRHAATQVRLLRWPADACKGAADAQ